MVQLCSVVPNCSTWLTTLDGEKQRIETTIHEQVKAQTGLEPVSIRPSKQGLGPVEGTRLVSFRSTVRPFRLHGTSSLFRTSGIEAADQAAQRQQLNGYDTMLRVSESLRSRNLSRRKEATFAFCTNEGVVASSENATIHSYAKTLSEEPFTEVSMQLGREIGFG
ncbi:hypothetical protein F4824DRAFT_154666 [Ustulina deusta]|nr:hypothetical protein F4824DRAFT_428577 [Ustulina deusta]KAI3335350.1 hypothetical protein F4824DRAFT_154666 [Ustulina deusta]